MQSWVVIEESGKLFLLELPHIRYYRFAIRNFIRYQKTNDVVVRLRNNPDMLPKSEAENVWWEYHESMINILIYGALSLEAYINYYAKRYEIPFNTDFEQKLSTLKKWKMYPFFKLKKGIQNNSLDIVKNIFKLRDDFVHPKPQRIAKDPEKTYEGKGHVAQLEKMDKGKLMQDINKVFYALFNIDEDEGSAHKKQPWLYDIIKQKS